MREFAWMAAPILVVIAGCGQSTPEIPDDVTYVIIEKNIIPGIKRSLTIRLNRRVSEDVLRSIGLKLKNSDPNTYERAFIGYYLPDMKVGAGHWASTHFNPNLKVRILGMTVEQEKALRQQPADPSREIIGSWLVVAPFTPERLTLYRRDGSLFMEEKFKDGSSGTKELVKRPSADEMRFEYKKGSNTGAYFIIDSQDNLQIWDDGGLYCTAKKIN